MEMIFLSEFTKDGKYNRHCSGSSYNLNLKAFDLYPDVSILDVSFAHILIGSLINLVLGKRSISIFVIILA